MRRTLATVAGLLAGLTVGPALAEKAAVRALTCTVVGPEAKPHAGEGEAGGLSRTGRCTFKPHDGPEEIYEAKLEGVTLTPTAGVRTVIWVVKGPSSTSLEPALLEQFYEAARNSRDDAMAVLFGTSNPQLELHHMADKPEGQASGPIKPRPTGFVILRLQLNLKAATG
jgi:hypothetical protein